MIVVFSIFIIRAASKEGKATAVTIRKVKEGKERKRELEKWIDDIWEMHRFAHKQSNNLKTYE